MTKRTSVMNVVPSTESCDMKLMASITPFGTLYKLRYIVPMTKQYVDMLVYAKT
jgi:hypothetical protein